MLKITFFLGLMLPIYTLAQNTAGNFLVGAARVDITPKPNPQWLPLNEFALEPLHIRAVVFSNNNVTGALLTIEIVSTTDQVMKSVTSAVAAELNTPIENIIFTATHSHAAGPAGPSLTAVQAYAAGPVGEYASSADAAVDAVKQARTNMRAAKVGFSTGAFYLNVNRDALNPLTGRWTQATNLTGSVDREVQVLSFMDHSNIPIASYTSYAMHPVQSYLSGYTSADWPGAMSTWVEAAFSTSSNKHVALLAQQASGDVNPLLRRTGTNTLASMASIPITGFEMAPEAIEEPIRDGYIPLVRPDVRYTRQLFQEITALGILLGEEVIRVMSTTTDWNSNPRIWGGQKNATCPGRKRLDTAREGVSGQYALPVSDIKILTSVVGLGDVVVSGVAAEIFTRIGFRIKDETPMRNRTMIVTLANGKATSGYVGDELSVNQTCFQMLGSSLLPGSCAEVEISSSIASLVTQFQSS